MLISSAPVSTSPATLPPLTLPAGFTDLPVVTGIADPRAFDFAPDGRIFILRLGSPTNPPGGSGIMEGQTITTPFSATRVIGIQTSINVPSPQLIGGSTYDFSSWSNGGAQVQTFGVPVGGGTYTATLSLETLPMGNHVYLPFVRR